MFAKEKYISGNILNPRKWKHFKLVKINLQELSWLDVLHTKKMLAFPLSMIHSAFYTKQILFTAKRRAQHSWVSIYRPEVVRGLKIGSHRRCEQYSRWNAWKLFVTLQKKYCTLLQSLQKWHIPKKTLENENHQPAQKRHARKIVRKGQK